MIGLAIAAAVVLGGVLILQAVFTSRFVAVYKRPAPKPIPDDQLPTALLILCLRGADPFLSRTLIAMFELDYPRVDFRIVVDSRDDPAWAVAEQAIAELGVSNVQLKALTDPLMTCGLRVGALVKELRELDEKYDVVAWLDADVIPHRDWLRQLVAPLQDPQVGATTGIRWYLPNPGGWGTMVRAIWNIGAIVQMVYFGIAFGGTMCVRSKLFRETDLLDRWSRLLWEDTYTNDAMASFGYRLEFVPGCTMSTQETIPLKSCFRFMCRQMLNARLYHHSWWFLLSFGLISSLTPYAVAIFGIVALIEHQYAAGAIALLAVVLQTTGMILLYAYSGSYPNRVVRKRKSPKVPNWRFPATVGLAVPLTALTYATSFLKIMATRRIEWRGIEYRIDGPWDIKLVEYKPYEPPAPEARRVEESL